MRSYQRGRDTPQLEALSRSSYPWLLTQEADNWLRPMAHRAERRHLQQRTEMARNQLRHALHAGRPAQTRRRRTHLRLRTARHRVHHGKSPVPGLQHLRPTQTGGPTRASGRRLCQNRMYFETAVLHHRKHALILHIQSQPRLADDHQTDAVGRRIQYHCGEKLPEPARRTELEAEDLLCVHSVRATPRAPRRSPQPPATTKDGSRGLDWPDTLPQPPMPILTWRVPFLARSQSSLQDVILHSHR